MLAAEQRELYQISHPRVSKRDKHRTQNTSTLSRGSAQGAIWWRHQGRAHMFVVSRARQCWFYVQSLKLDYFSLIECHIQIHHLKLSVKMDL